MKKIFLFSFLAFISSPALAVVDAGSEQRRFEDEQLYKEMQEHLETDPSADGELITFADEDPAALPKKNSSPSRKQ